MKFIQSLTLEQANNLRDLHKEGTTHRVRQRAHAVLLSAKGYTINQLSDIFELDRDTVSEWLRVWEQHGVAALGDAPKSGRPSKLEQVVREELVQTVREAPSPTLKIRLLENLKKKA